MAIAKRTWMPTTAGIVSIVAGAIHLLGWIILSLVVTVTSARDGRGDYPFLAAFIFIFLIITAIVAIIGGIFAIQRRSWGLSLAGAICAIFGPLTWLLGVFAVVLVILSKNEFDHPGVVMPPSAT